jgi:UDP-N-acetylmuramate dehydrogenase
LPAPTRRSVPAAAHRHRSTAAAAALAAAGLAPERDVPLASLARWRIGGPADLLVRPADTAGVARAVAVARDHDLPLFVMGDGSNMLFDDRGFRGLVVMIGPALGGFAVAGTRVQAGAGLWVPDLARRLARAGLAGLEHVVGIPGRLGGLVVMNGGSQRKGIGTHVHAVTVVRPDGTVARRTQAALGYSYRHSALQGSGEIVTGVELELAPGDRGAIRREMVAILAARRAKFPKNLPNCGSTFLSDPAMYDRVGPPGKAIEAAGLKGLAIGGAQISPLHANFIVNRGGATAQEVLALVALIRETVRARTGFAMDCEVRHLTETGEEAPLHVFTDAGRFDRSLPARKD